VEIGLVHRAVPLDELMPAATEYARDLARNCSPQAMAAIKGQVWADWAVSFGDAQRQARMLLDALRQRDDFREGVQSFVERRPAAFGPLTQKLDPADYSLD
jgi:enoyl-CoA hydratase/carnithine racemase